jgi:tetratricopeptide (TPR) repeat protein
MTQYTRAIELEPRHFKALFNRGFSHDKLGQYAEAIADYSAALQVEPRNAYAFYNRGITYDRMGEYANAVDDFTCAIAIDDSNADFFHNRGFRCGRVWPHAYYMTCHAPCMSYFASCSCCGCATSWSFVRHPHQP